MCIAQTQRCLCALFQIFGLYFGQLKDHSLSTLIGECGEGKKHKFQSWKPSGLQIWHKEWYGYLIIQIHQPWSWPFSMLHFQSIDWSIYIYDIVPCLSLFKKNNTYFCFNKLTKKKCHLQHLFQPFSTWFLETMWLLPVWHAVLSRNL